MKTTVIIPAYNAEEYLPNTIYSVLKQVRPPEEIIVVDDGSSDDTAAIAQGFSPRVLTIKQDNEGAAAARNTGAEAATGDALMFLDADDVLGPNALDGLLSALYRNPGTIALCPWNTLQFINGQWQIKSPNTPPRRFGQDDLSAWLSGWFHTPCSVLWSREAYEQTGPWDECISVNDDGEIMMRAMIMDISLVRASYGRSYYRRLEAESESLSDARFSRSGLESRLLVLDKVSDLLEQQDKLDRYSFPLSEAYELIANDCSQEYAGLRERALVAARHFGGSHWCIQLKKQVSEILSKFERAYYRHIPSMEIDQSFPVHEGILMLDTIKVEQKKYTTHQQDDFINYLPGVSVIIPTFNREYHLQKAVKTVLKQTYDNFEVLVVDDGSEDNTQEAMLHFVSKDPRVQYIRLHENSGVVTARNTAMHLARGEFIAFLDSDDEWFKEKLKLQIQKYQDLPKDTGLIYTGVKTVTGEKDDGKLDHPEWKGELYNRLIIKNEIYTTSGVLIKKQVVDTIGFFDASFPANEDWDYWIRLSKHFRINYVDEVLMQYTAASDIERKSLNLQDDINARILIYNKNRNALIENRTASIFLCETARRMLVPLNWYPKRARTLLIKAARENIFRLQIYTLFLRSTLPYGIYVRLRGYFRKNLNRFKF